MPPQMRKREKGDPSEGLFASGSLDGPDPKPDLAASSFSDAVSEEAEGRSPWDWEAEGKVLFEGCVDVVGVLASGGLYL